MNLLKLLFTRRYGFPMNKRDIWYNFSVHSNEKYPIVFDENKKYIDCKVGNSVQMGVTDCGKKVFYKITKMWRTRGSDFLYPSDAINCDMVFSHVTK